MEGSIEPTDFTWPNVSRSLNDDVAGKPELTSASTRVAPLSTDGSDTRAALLSGGGGGDFPPPLSAINCDPDVALNSGFWFGSLRPFFLDGMLVYMQPNAQLS
jgi:hypothetical protein